MLFRHTQGRATRVAVGSLAALAVCATLCISAVVAQASDKALKRAERALREGEYELAEKLFLEVVSKEAHNSRARLGLSYALLKQRKLQGAYDHAAYVLAANPHSSRAHALVGAAVLASGNFRVSVAEFRTALSIKDDEALAIAGLAMVDFYENRLQDSLIKLRRAHFIDPREPDYIFNLAQTAARTERYREAADAYERFLDIAPHTDEDRRARIRGLIDFLRYLGKQGPLYIPGGASSTVVPFYTTDHRPVIHVRVNGSKVPLRFVLDTGSGMTVISDETARRLGLSAVARGGLARAVGGGGRFEIVYGFLDSIHIGEARMANVPVYIRRFYDKDNPVDGYIGLSVISKFITTVDYGARTFMLMRQRSGDIDPASAPTDIEIPIRTTLSGFLSGEVHLDGVSKPLNFIIDTGASISVVSEVLMASEGMSRFAQSTRMRVYGAAGVTEDVTMLLLPRIIFGSYAHNHIRAAVLDLEPINETAGFAQNGILGANFLRHFRITFDFQRAVIRLEPLTAPAPENQGVRRTSAITERP